MSEEEDKGGLDLSGWDDEDEGEEKHLAGAQPKDPAPAKPGKPLYQPPSPSDFLRPSAPRPAEPETGSRLADFDVGFDDFDDESTRMAEVPEDLIRSIREQSAPTRNETPTQPPPGAEESGGLLLDVEIDVDLDSGAPDVMVPASGEPPPLFEDAGGALDSLLPDIPALTEPAPQAETFRPSGGDTMPSPEAEGDAPSLDSISPTRAAARAYIPPHDPLPAHDTLPPAEDDPFASERPTAGVAAAHRPVSDSEGPEIRLSELPDDLFADMDDGGPALSLSDLPDDLFEGSTDQLASLLDGDSQPPLYSDAEADAGAADTPDLLASEPPPSGLSEFEVDGVLGIADKLESDFPPPAESPAPEPARDVGADAARRTVTRRKPRHEHFPLVGRNPAALRSRAKLLTGLADGAEGSARAGLLVTAAEMLEQLGETDQAHELYMSAHEADGADLVALRALRRETLGRGDWPRSAELLRAEASLRLSPVDRELALTLLAEVELRGLHDPAAAERTARAALELRPDAVVPNLLLAEAKLSESDLSASLAATAGAAGAWNDERARAALLSDAAIGFEAAGLPGRAAELYPKASEADPSSLIAALGLFRAERSSGKGAEAVITLRDAVERLPKGAARSALHLAQIRATQLMLGNAEEAFQLLPPEGDRAVLRARALAARAAEGVEALASGEAWAGAAGGTERAVALCGLADVLGASGDLDGADQALRDAALADSTVGSVIVLRELLARKTGDSTRLSRAAEDSNEGALGAAAKIACSQDAAARERELLARALHEGDSPVTADTLMLDVAAAIGDRGEVEASLRRRVERAAVEMRVGPLLALADLHRASENQEAVASLLREAAQSVAGDPLVTRPLARSLHADAPGEAAALYLEEADVTSGSAGAYAATMAGRALERAGEDARSAYKRALDILPDYAPAAWAYEPLARAANDEQALAEIQSMQAELAADPIEAAGRWIRAAQLASTTEEKADLLDRARIVRPDDPIVYDLLLRLRPEAPARAELLMESARVAGPKAARAARLRAAAAFEEAGEHANAASLYREVLEEIPGDPVASLAVERAEIEAEEVARAAERRFNAVRNAEDDDAKVAALEALATLDRDVREDDASATLSLEAILEIAPGHIPSLRKLETYYMDAGRDPELLRIESALARHLGTEEDIAEHLQLAARLLLCEEDAEGDAADSLLLDLAEGAAFDAGLARRILGAARAHNDHGRIAAIGKHLAGRLDEPMERASILIETSEALLRCEGAEAAAELLRPAAYGAPEHPLAAAALARLYEAASDPTEAAEAHELAARACLASRRAIYHWHSAGMLWQDQVDDVHRALGAFEEVAAIDIAYRDVFDRMKTMLTELGKPSRLSELTSARLEAGGEPPVLVALYLTQSEIAEDLDDREGARAALRAALALAPDELETIRRLATLSLEDEDWQSASEALIGLARLLRDREELRWVFFTLGDLYDHHLPDPRRAEAAFKRVLKLVPEDLEALDRVSDVLVGQENFAEAVRALTRLAQLEKDPERGRDARIRLARAYVGLGKVREAESVLEAIRRQRTTDVAVIEAMVELYQGQGAESALSMHLNRAIADFRKAIGNDPGDESLWTGMARILADKGRDDPARVIAAGAYALGHHPRELGARIGELGAIPGAGAAAMADELIESLLPRGLSRAAIEVFRLGGDALDRALPFDAKAWRATKLGGRDNPLRAEALRVAKWFDVTDVQILVTREAPRVFMPVGSSPITLLIGAELPEITDEPERAFLFARAIHMAKHHLDAAVRSRPEDLTLAIAALIHVFDPTYAPEGVDRPSFDEMARRMSKGVSRKIRDDLSALVREMCGQPGFDPSALGFAAAELGDRAALLALGSPTAGIGALLKLGGASIDGLTSEQRAGVIRSSGEAWRLLAFTLSDLHFDARHTTGADGF